MGFLIFLGSVLVIVIAIVVANEFGNIAEQKGHDKSKYFWYTLLLGWIGMLMVAVLPNQKGSTVQTFSKATTDSLDLPEL